MAHPSPSASPAFRFRRARSRALRASDASARDMVMVVVAVTVQDEFQRSTCQWTLKFTSTCDFLHNYHHDLILRADSTAVECSDVGGEHVFELKPHQDRAHCGFRGQALRGGSVPLRSYDIVVVVLPETRMLATLRRRTIHVML